MPNVFISHRTADLPWAESLATELKAHGHSVWLDAWNISLGDSIVARINEGLTGACYVVLCYSSHDMNAPWMSREWMSTLARQLNGEAVKILPLLLPGGNVPPILADIKYVNAAAGMDATVQALLKVLN